MRLKRLELFGFKSFADRTVFEFGDQTLTAIITRDAVEELKLRRGDEALAIVKSTEVMVAREAAPPPRPATASTRHRAGKSRPR